MSTSREAVDQMFDQDYSNFRDSIQDILMDKLRGRVENEKIAVGQALFSDDFEDEIEFEEDNEDISNEEI